MNISEANDVNTVIAHLLAVHDIPGPTDEEALAAMGRLADRAYRALGAGIDAEQILRHWKRVPAGIRRRRPLAEDLRGLAVKLRAGGAPDAAALVDQAASEVAR